MESVTDLLDRVEGDAHTLTVYNCTDADEVIDVFEDHFGRRNTTVEQAATPSGEPTDFAVLRDGERFLAAGPIEPAYRTMTFDAGAFSQSAFEPIEYPEILEHAATTAFTSYDKRRMILASREIETRAWRVGAGELYAGFQRLSVMRHQWDVYAKLARSGVAVHAYGAPDWTPPDANADGMTFQADDDREVRNSWFVVFGGDGEDRHKAALVDEIVAYFRNDRAPVSSPGVETARTAD